MILLPTKKVNEYFMCYLYIFLFKKVMLSLFVYTRMNFIHFLCSENRRGKESTFYFNNFWKLLLWSSFAV